MILNLSFCTETPCNIKRHRTRFQNGFGLIVSSEPTNNLVYVPNCLWCQVKTNMPMHVKAIWVYLSEDLHLLKCKSFFLCGDLHCKLCTFNTNASCQSKEAPFAKCA